jgi:hypothetical protein
LEPTTTTNKYTRKLSSHVLAASAGAYAMFFADYHVEGMEHQDHVFSNIRTDARDFIDRTIYGIPTSTATSTTSSTTNRELRENVQVVAAAAAAAANDSK